MKFLRALDAKQIQKSLISGIKLNTNEEEFLQILPQVEEFMHAIDEDVKTQDEFVLRWFPVGTILSIYQGKEISTIRNDGFARTLWSIWFGKESVVDRKTLVEQLLVKS
jgi:oligoribonuclease (3'-5' exoribonuclease)